MSNLHLWLYDNPKIFLFLSANPLGIMVGSLLAPAIVNPSPGAKLDGYFQTLVCYAIVLLLLVYMF